MVFCDDGLDVWFSDLQWAWNEDKTHALLLDIFPRRKRFSPVQGRLWCRVVCLYWREGWTARQIGEHFGVSIENIRRIIQSLRREATRFFGQALQPPEGQALQPKSIAEPPRKSREAIAADPTNESQDYWNAVLASHGFFNPDKRARGWTPRNPIVKFDWPSRISVHAQAFWEADIPNCVPTNPRCQHLQKSGPRKQIGTKSIQIDGEQHQVRLFEAGRPAGTFRLVADPRNASARRKASSTYAAFKHVDAAIDGSRDAREYLQGYDELEAEKYQDPRGFQIVPGISDPCEGRPIIQKFAGPQANRGIDVRIDADGTVRKKGSNQPCGHVEKISSDETTRTACQIGHAEINAVAIPTRDDLIADAKQDQPHRDSY